MPGRRVSRHSKAKTLPATVALPIFRSRSRMGPGRVLMGLPIKILEALTAPPFFSPSAGAPAWDDAAAEAEGVPAGSLHVTSTSTFRKPYTPHQQPLELRPGILPQLRPGGQTQRDGHVGLIDAGAGQHSSCQLQPQLAGKLQFREHFKKWDVS